MSGNTIAFVAETSARPLTFFKGAQSVRLRRAYNVFVYNVQCDAVVFESQPPFYMAETLTTGGSGVVCAYQ